MNAHRLTIGEWLMAITGVALFALLFAHWYRFSPADGGPSSGLTAWQAFTVPDVLLALLAVAAVATVPLVAAARTPSPGIAWESLVLLGAIIGVVICVVRLIDVPADGLSLRPGAWAGLAVTAGLCASSLIAMRDERRSTPGRPTDATGVPVETVAVPEELAAPPR